MSKMHRSVQILSGILWLAVCTLAHAQPSQIPLLTRSASVEPNLVLMFDDSASMPAQFIYQYGGTQGVYGRTGPGSASNTASCSDTLSMTTTCTYNPPSVASSTWVSGATYAANVLVTSPLDFGTYKRNATACPPANWINQNYSAGVLVTYSSQVYRRTTTTSGFTRSNNPVVAGTTYWTPMGATTCLTDDPSSASGSNYWNSVTPGAIEYAQLSPDVNGIHYDPRVRYKPRIGYDGSTAAALTAVGTPSTADFSVYFYKDGNGKNVVWPGKITSTNSAGGDPFRDPLLATAYFIPSVSASSLNSANAPSPLAAGAETGLVYPNIVTNSNASQHLPKFLDRTDCTGGTATSTYCTVADEQLNYAIWKKYHSNRLDLAKTGLGYAFQNLTASLRLGWGVINTLDGGTLDSGVGLFDTARKQAFYDWLHARTGSVPGTPNRLALKTVGEYYKRADIKGPWSNSPDPTSIGSTFITTSGSDDATARAKHFSCRRNYAMLVTDGYYNDSTGSIGVGNVDGTAITAIAGSTPSGSALSYSYNGSQNPYPGGGTDTMADVAMKYWITDLRTDLPNNVKQVTTNGLVSNPSFWQNMGFYAVGLGIYGTLTQTPATLANLSASPQLPNTNIAGTSVTGWPTAVGDQEEAVDDMWHATINGRGRLLSAKNSGELSNAVEGMLAEINLVDSSQSGVAASAAALVTNTRKYSPRYTTGSWNGDIIATVLDAGSAADKCIAWQITENSTENATLLPFCQPNPGTAAATGNGIPAFGSRNIYTWNGSGYGNFDSSNTYVTSNVVGGSNANLINFLRGDQSNEDVTVNGIITTPRSYRTRTKLLGDIINSTPTFIGGALDMGYDKLPAGSNGQASYSAYVQLKKARTEGVLFAGANDGMLHGFRDTTGVEVFAFVPRAIMPNLHLLASRSYSHTYYVDGTTTEVDACLGTANRNCAASEWSNLLVGSLGAGGKEVFAIDVTTLTPSPSMGMSASNIKWEITSASTGFGNLGYTLADVQTGLLPNGTWVAVFGNGYYGADGKAHLYVANLNTGAFIQDIDTGVGSGNGLSGVTLALDSNKRILGAYAGDLKGNMWKFDLAGGSASKLYAAGSTKPVTAPPAIVDHPNGGRVVTFGTGKLFDTGDTAAGSTQSFYGIWDSVAFGASTTTLLEANRTSDLVQQTLGSAIAGTYVSTNANLTTQNVSLSGYSQTKNAIDWTTKKGWFLDMPSSGERMVYPMASLFGRLVLAYTISPSSSSDPCTQTQSGNAWSYVFDLLTGARPDSDVYLGCIGCSRLSLSKGPIGPPVVICQVSNTGSCFALPPTDCRPGDSNCPSPPEIKKFCGAQTGIPCAPSKVKRTWRQLFMR